MGFLSREEAEAALFDQAERTDADRASVAPGPVLDREKEIGGSGVSS